MYFPSYFALSRSQSFGLLCLLLALLLSCLLLALLFSVLFIFSPDLRRSLSAALSSASSLRCSCRCLLVPLCSLAVVICRILTTGSSAVVLFSDFSFSTCSLAVALSLILFQRHFVVGYSLPGCLACTSNTTTQHCALRDRWLAVGARAPGSCTLQQRVLLTMGTDLSFWSFGRFVAAAVRRWFPTPLRHHCVILWAVSTLITKAYIAASCHWRGPSVRSASQACHRSSLSLSLWFDFLWS